VFHYSYAPYLAESGVDIMTSRGPNVARWWTELMSRPAWAKLKREGIRVTVSYVTAEQMYALPIS